MDNSLTDTLTSTKDREELLQVAAAFVFLFASRELSHGIRTAAVLTALGIALNILSADSRIIRELTLNPKAAAAVVG